MTAPFTGVEDMNNELTLSRELDVLRGDITILMSSINALRHEIVQQRPIQRSLCRTLRDETHWKCLILSVLMYSSLTVVLWCEMATVAVASYTYRGSPVTIQDSPCEDGYMYIPVAFLVLLYLVYLLECWYSEIRIEIYYKEDTRTVSDRVRRIRESFPVVWWRAISYHYNRHTRQVTRYRHGDTYTTTQEYYERINTHSAASAFDFMDCGVKDVSKQLLGLDDYPMTRISFSKNFMFLNEEAEFDYLSQRARFFSESDGRDENMETREGLTLTDVEFTDDMISYAYSDKLPWYFSMSVFWAMSFILLSWPYRILVSYKTAIVDYQIEKLFGTNYSGGMLSMEHWNGETLHLARVGTVGSNCSLESMIRGNRHVVPSYSEAILMDLANGNAVHHHRAGQTSNGNGSLGNSRRSNVGGSDGFLANSGSGISNSSRRGNAGRRLFSFTSAKRSLTAPLHGSGILSTRASPNALRAAIGASAHFLFAKDRLKGSPNGRASPITIQLTPTVNGIGTLHLTGPGTIPKTPKNDHIARATMAGVNPPNTQIAASAAGPKPTPADGISQTKNTKKRPNSLPICFAINETDNRGESNGNNRCLESWVVVDSNQGSIRTIIREPNVSHPAVPADHQSVPATRHLLPQPAPNEPPPTYEVALELEAPRAGESEPMTLHPLDLHQDSPLNVNMETSL